VHVRRHRDHRAAHHIPSAHIALRHSTCRRAVPLLVEVSPAGPREPAPNRPLRPGRSPGARFGGCACQGSGRTYAGLGLLLFGWGFWFWSVPMLALLVTLLRYDFGNAMRPRRFTLQGRHRP
jgi:hypothetical protein